MSKRWAASILVLGAYAKQGETTELSTKRVQDGLRKIFWRVAGGPADVTTAALDVMFAGGSSERAVLDGLRGYLKSDQRRWLSADNAALIAERVLTAESPNRRGVLKALLPRLPTSSATRAKVVSTLTDSRASFAPTLDAVRTALSSATPLAERAGRLFGALESAAPKIDAEHLTQLTEATLDALVPGYPPRLQLEIPDALAIVGKLSTMSTEHRLNADQDRRIRRKLNQMYKQLAPVHVSALASGRRMEHDQIASVRGQIDRMRRTTLRDGTGFLALWGKPPCKTSPRRMLENIHHTLQARPWYHVSTYHPDPRVLMGPCAFDEPQSPLQDLAQDFLHGAMASLDDATFGQVADRLLSSMIRQVQRRSDGRVRDQSDLTPTEALQLVDTIATMAKGRDLDVDLTAHLPRLDQHFGWSELSDTLAARVNTMQARLR